jgi:hypothetical protein
MIAYASHVAAMNRVEDGIPRREWLAASAKAGNQIAIDALEEPPFPDPIAYLWKWVLEIRRGLGMEGLTWTALHAWARLSKRLPEPHEVEAIFDINAALVNGAMPDEQKAPTSVDSTSYDAAEPRKSAWPAKKPVTEGAP